jgi:hypothetical protein
LAADVATSTDGEGVMPRGNHTCACGSLALLDDTHVVHHGRPPRKHSFQECDPDEHIAHQVMHPLSGPPSAEERAQLKPHRRFAVPVTK